MAELISIDENGESTQPKREVLNKLEAALSAPSAEAAEQKAYLILKTIRNEVINNDPIRTPERRTALRSYSHPVDAGIVRMLDRPLINGIFKSYIDFCVNTQWGQILAGAIPVTGKTFPGLNQIVGDCVEILRIKRPKVVISNSVSGINAVTFGSDQEPFIALSSILLRLMSNEELQFIVGHECGHIAMGHMVYHNVAATIGDFFRWIPVIGTQMANAITVPLHAWSRRSEITADRAGLLCCGNLPSAQKALLQLECGMINADTIDMEEYLSFTRNILQGKFSRKFSEYLATHPLTPKRIEALAAFSQSECYAELSGFQSNRQLLTDRELAETTEKILRVA